MDSILDSHEVMYHQKRELIEVAYLKALGRGIHDPVVILLDLRDPFADGVAKKAGPKVVEAFTTQVAEADRRGVQPIGCNGHGRDGVRSLLEWYTEVVEALAERREGSFPAVVIAGGQATVRETPIP